MDETPVWQGRSSQSSNLGTFILCGLLFWLIVPIFIALKKYLEVRSTHYTLTTQRLRVARGVFSKRIDDLELYRVKDHALLKPFFQRLLGTGDIVLTTSDQTTPQLVLHAIRGPERVRDLIREQVERERDRKNVREVDMT